MTGVQTCALPISIFGTGIVARAGVDPETGLPFRSLGCVLDAGTRAYVDAYNGAVRESVKRNGLPANSYKADLLTCEDVAALFAEGGGSLPLDRDHPETALSGGALARFHPPVGGVTVEFQGRISGIVPGLSDPRGYRVAEAGGGKLVAFRSPRRGYVVYDPRRFYAVQDLRCAASPPTGDTAEHGGSAP